jgi:hypothetical protein
MIKLTLTLIANSKKFMQSQHMRLRVAIVLKDTGKPVNQWVAAAVLCSLCANSCSASPIVPLSSWAV